MYDPRQLLALAQAYCAATGMSLARLGSRAAGNRVMFKRLADGCGCNVSTAQRAWLWLGENWPADSPWPAAIPRHGTDNPQETASALPTECRECNGG
jgi:hypothetical protein